MKNIGIIQNISHIFILSLLMSCGRNTEYPGFSRGKEGVYFQLHKIGESTRKAMFSDYITADIEYATLSDSVFFKGRRKLQLNNSKARGSIEACFRMLAEGESATFIVSADEFFTKTLETSLPVYFQSGDMMKIKLDIIEIQTQKEYNHEKEAFLNWIDDFGDYEKIILQQFLMEEEIPAQPTEAGLYYFCLKEGTGKKVEKGDTVTVNYEGRFLNGKFFDSTIRRKQPFQFVYGTEWQVVPGLEKAIGIMKEGGRSLVILPSELAFGQEGSSTGIIPPFTSLIFEIEIIAIN